MSEKMGENLGLVSSPSPPAVPSPRHEGVNVDERTRPTTGWTEPHTSTNGPKQERNGSFDMGFGLGMKFDEQELKFGEFTAGNGLHEAEPWGRFSPATGTLSGLANQNYPFNGLSASPETSETATPPSMSGPFQTTLRGPGVLAIEEDSTMRSGPNMAFGRGVDEYWTNDLEEFERKSNEQTFPPLHLPYLGLDANGAVASLPNSHTLPALGTGYAYPPHTTPFHGLLPNPFPNHNEQLPQLRMGQFSPPPTAASSTSSGSSSPFIRARGFERPGWKPYGSGGERAPPSPPLGPDHRPLDREHYPHHPRTQEWGMEVSAGTCDPRGITGPREQQHHEHKHALSDMNESGSSRYGEAMLAHNHVPSQSHSHGSDSPAFSDRSSLSDVRVDAQTPLKRGRGRPRRADPLTRAGTDSYYNAPKTVGPGAGAYYKIKKKPGDEQQQLGMGLEDVDETALEFTSRQDTKPTRMLRRQCYNCRTWRDVSAWRRSIMQVGHIVCNKCGLYEKAHKKSRPLNDRGEFVRPGKQVPKAGVKGIGRGRGRARASSDAVVGAGVMRFETDDGPTK